MAHWLYLPGYVKSDAGSDEPKKATANSERLSLLWLRSEHWLAAAPPILLAGMYGAAAFSLLALGPPWLGFLVSVVPVAGTALWALARPVKELSG